MHLIARVARLASALLERFDMYSRGITHHRKASPLAPNPRPASSEIVRPKVAVGGRFVTALKFIPMPRKDIAEAPHLFCIAAKELVDRIEQYKASCTASDHRLANGAFTEARRLLIDVRSLLHSIGGSRGGGSQRTANPPLGAR